MVNRILATLVLAALAGCGGSGTPSDPHGGDAKVSYPEIFIFNGYLRFRRLGANTEQDTVERMVVGQRTAVTLQESLAATVHAGGTVDCTELLLTFASWRVGPLRRHPAAPGNHLRPGRVPRATVSPASHPSEAQP